jgi:hypothetical protein
VGTTISKFHLTYLIQSDAVLTKSNDERHFLYIAFTAKRHYGAGAQAAHPGIGSLHFRTSIYFQLVLADKHLPYFLLGLSPAVP